MVQYVKEEMTMSKRASLVPLLAILLGAASPALARNIARPRFDRGAQFVPHELLVKFKRGTPAYVRAEIHRGAGAAVLRRFARDPRLEQVRLPEGENLDSAIAYYSTRADVQYVQKNFVYHTTDAVALPPNDYYFGNQYAWQDFTQFGVNAVAAWQKTTGRFSVVVADLDTGVDYTHPDLGLNIWTNPGEAGRNCYDERDNDADGYVDDCRGWNFIYGNNDPMDDSGEGHGTHIAGIIGALTNNGIGVAGANWDIQIMPLKTADANGIGTTVTAIQGLEYAVAHGATIANYSSGYYSTGSSDNDVAFRDAIKAAGDAGLLFVTSAGNDSNDNDSNPFYPCSFSRADTNNPDPPTNILCVAATENFYGDLASFSNYGANTVNLGAPGVGVLSTVQWSGDQYSPLQGTSVSTSFVTGGAALIKACNPSLTAVMIKDILLYHVQTNYDLTGRTTSGGEVDYGAAVVNDTVGACVAAPTGSAPVAKSGGPYHGNLRRPVQFEGNASSDTGGQILLYFWDFGDGFYGSGEQVSHLYTSTGVFTATLTVRDNLGAEASESTTVTVNPTGHAWGLTLVRSLTQTRQVSRRSDLKR
jgi:subtilisin family serine protease